MLREENVVTREQIYKDIYNVSVSYYKAVEGLCQNKASRKANIVAIKRTETVYQNSLTGE